MRISEITADDVAKYARIDNCDEREITIIMDSAKHYIVGYTGIPAALLDDYEDLSIAYLVLCQDMYDNRALYVDNQGGRSIAANRLIEGILGMHSHNLI